MTTTIVPMPADWLGGQQKHAVKMAAAKARDVLDLPPGLTVCFYVLPDDPEATCRPDMATLDIDDRGVDMKILAGFTLPYSQVVWVKFTLSPAEMANAVAHELRHAWQQNKSAEYLMGDRESDAKAFAAGVVEAIERETFHRFSDVPRRSYSW